MDVSDNTNLNKQYISYFKISKYLFVYGLIVLVYTLVTKDNSYTYVILNISVSTLNFISIFILLSVICGGLHYILTVNSPYKANINKLLSVFPRKEVIFNYQFQLLIAPHLVFILLFLV